MAPRLHYTLKPLLFHILAGLFAVLVLVSVASARRRTSYNSHESIHVHDDEGGYGHIKEKSRAECGKDPMNLHHDDDGDEKQGYGNHKGVIYEYYSKADDGHGYSIGKPKKLSEVVPVSISVQGVDLCQDCKYVGSDSLIDATPVAGAQVKLVCQTRSSSLSAAITTDSNGFFLISVPDFNFDFITSQGVQHCNRHKQWQDWEPTYPDPNIRPIVKPDVLCGAFCMCTGAVQFEAMNGWTTLPLRQMILKVTSFIKWHHRVTSS